MILLFSLLSMLALACGLGIIVLMLRPSTRGLAVREFAPFALPAAATVATVATVGSLYVSEVANYVPCRLCWVQRGFMYPLALVLIVASIRQWKTVAIVGLFASLLGGAVSVYHYAEQQLWIGGSESFCDVDVPCSARWVNEFGFVSIPFMAFTGFLFVAAMMWLLLATNRSNQTT